MIKLVIRIVLFVLILYHGSFAFFVGDLRNPVRDFFNEIQNDNYGQITFNTLWAIYSDYRADLIPVNIGTGKKLHIFNSMDGVKFRLELWPPVLLENCRAPSRYHTYTNLDGSIPEGDECWKYRYEKIFLPRPALDFVHELNNRAGALEVWTRILNSYGGAKKFKNSCINVVGLNDKCMPDNLLHISQEYDIIDSFPSEAYVHSLLVILYSFLLLFSFVHTFRGEHEYYGME